MVSPLLRGPKGLFCLFRDSIQVGRGKVARGPDRHLYSHPARFHQSYRQSPHRTSQGHASACVPGRRRPSQKQGDLGVHSMPGDRTPGVPARPGVCKSESQDRSRESLHSLFQNKLCSRGRRTEAIARAPHTPALQVIRGLRMDPSLSSCSGHCPLSWWAGRVPASVRASPQTSGPRSTARSHRGRVAQRIRPRR